jgi:hypothetical protein
VLDLYQVFAIRKVVHPGQSLLRARDEAPSIDGFKFHLLAVYEDRGDTMQPVLRSKPFDARTDEGKGRARAGFVGPARCALKV